MKALHEGALATLFIVQKTPQDPHTHREEATHHGEESTLRQEKSTHHGEVQKKKKTKKKTGADSGNQPQ